MHWYSWNRDVLVIRGPDGQMEGRNFGCEGRCTVPDSRKGVHYPTFSALLTAEDRQLVQRLGVD